MGRSMGEFLRASRAKVSPAEVGLGDGFRRRRVPGLRREEVAELAGVSVDYYMRLEQGRNGNPSSSVLDAVAHALHLDHDERRHLYDLAWPDRVVEEAGPADDGESDEVMLRLLSSLVREPALVLTPTMQVAAANDAARILFGSLITPPGSCSDH